MNVFFLLESCSRVLKSARPSGSWTDSIFKGTGHFFETLSVGSVPDNDNFLCQRRQPSIYFMFIWGVGIHNGCYSRLAGHKFYVHNTGKPRFEVKLLNSMDFAS